MRKVGFIDVGIMGKPTVRNLRRAGYEISIYTRTKAKVEDVIAEGTRWCDIAAERAKGQDVVITIVGYPKDVEEAYFGESGIIADADKGTYLISMTTTNPKPAVRTYEEAMKARLYTLDTPMAGGDIDTKAGTLAILASGDKEMFDACLSMLEAVGKNVNYEGKAGNGQHIKMCNQTAIAGILVDTYKAMTYAKKVGLDADIMLKSISTGVARSAQMNNVASKVLVNDPESGFFLRHFTRDTSLADEEVKDVSTELTALEDVLSIYRGPKAGGMGDLGTQALIKHYNW